MLKTAEAGTPHSPDGFPGRLRQVVNSYGSTNSLARAIDRSEGALRKWLRGLTEPNVSDLRAICEVTETNVEWLVMGRGDRKRPTDPGGFAMRDGPGVGSGELPPMSYKLMDDVVRSVRHETPVLLGDLVAPEKQSSVLATVYNLSRRTGLVDPEAVSRVVALAL